MLCDAPVDTADIATGYHLKCFHDGGETMLFRFIFGRFVARLWGVLDKRITRLYERAGHGTDSQEYKDYRQSMQDLQDALRGKKKR